MLLFGFVLFLGGFFSSGGTASLKASLVFCCFMLGYFLVANLLRTTERIERMAAAMLIAALIVAAIGVFQYVTGSAESTWQDTTMFSDISGRVVSTFANPNVLAEYLVMMLPICGAMLITSKRGTERAFYPLTFIMLGLCLVFTWSRGAWLGFLAGAAMFLLIWSRKFMVAGWFGLMAVPAVYSPPKYRFAFCEYRKYQRRLYIISRQYLEGRQQDNQRVLFLGNRRRRGSL